MLLGTACSHGGKTSAPSAPSTTSTSSTSTTAAPTTTSTSAPAAVRPPGLPAPVDIPAVLGRIEATMRLGGVTEDAAWHQQVIYRALGRDAALRTSVVRAVPSAVRSVVSANADAAAALYLLTKPRTDLPPWRIVPAAPADELLADYRAAEYAVGVPWYYLAAINFVETKFGRVRGPSTAGAQGPMQFIPSTWQRYGNGGDINNDRDAIFAAARLLKANGMPGNPDGALFRYNPSSLYVKAVKLYAGVIHDSDAAFRAYYDWHVYLRMTTGDRVLLEGYPAVAPIPA